MTTAWRCVTQKALANCIRHVVFATYNNPTPTDDDDDDDDEAEESMNQLISSVSSRTFYFLVTLRATEQLFAKKSELCV